MRLPLPLILALTTSAALSVRAQDSTEHWHGHAGNSVNGVTIDVTITSAGNDLSGTITLHELAAMDIPLRRVSRTADQVELELEIEKAVMTFTGRVQNGAIIGTYAMGPMCGPFELARVTPGPKPYRPQEVRFESKDGVVLGGTLLLPSGNGPFPAAVFLHGSGPMTRDGNRYVADGLARSGIAALIYDKRGSGESGGDLAKSDFHSLADDAAAAVLFLRRRADIDPSNVGFVGASQAGWIGTMAAADLRNIAFLAFTSAPVVTVARESWWDYEARLRQQNASEADIAAAREILRLDDEVTRTGKGWDELQRALADARSTSWFAAMDFEVAPLNDPARVAFRPVMDFDPVPLLRGLQSPALWVFGGRDATAPSDWSIDNLVVLLKEGKEYSLRVFPEADHAMITVPADLADGGWPRRVPEHASVVTDWVVHVTARRAAMHTARCSAIRLRP